jgi:hypothetical protein
LSINTLFGAPLGYAPAVLDLWIADLQRAWTAFAGAPPGSLDDDLAALAKVFAGTSGRALRTVVTDLPDADERLLILPESILMQAEGRVLITPEGRILLDVLEDLRANHREVIDAERQTRALAIAVEARSAWYREWARKQLSGALSPPALGAAVFLVVNGSVGTHAALRLPMDEADDVHLGGLILPIVGRFSLALGGKQPMLDVGIQSHWAFSQISRFLARDIAREKVADGSALYVREGRERPLLTDLAERLAKYTLGKRRHALEQLTEDYRDRRGALVAAGVCHEEPVHTRRVARTLMDEGDR